MYPTGVFFPVKKEIHLAFEGEVIRDITLEGGRLFFSTYNGDVYCIDAATKKIVWIFHAPIPLTSETFVTEEKIFIEGEQRTLIALDKNGNQLWSYESADPITSAIIENRDQVYFGTEKGVFIALNSSNGEENWRLQAEGAIRSNPVLTAEAIVFGCDNGLVYFLNPNGKLKNTFQASDPIGRGLLTDDSFLYFCTDSPYFLCYDLQHSKIKWKIRINGKVLVPPVAHKKMIYVITWNGILYCLEKKSGHIVWWRNVPSRSSSRLEVVEDKILVSSLSSRLVCFNAKSGESAGYYLAEQEIRSNPVWFGSRIIISLFDQEENKGGLAFLKKVIRVDLKSSRVSPQKPNEEIVITADPVGFFQPEFEFFQISEGTREIVREKSEERTWAWFPSEEGIYTIGVTVTDEKETVEVDMEYRIIGIEKVIESILRVLPRALLWGI